MSIAFQAIVLVALALPGLIFLRHVQGDGRFHQRRPITDEIARGLVAAALLHAVWCCAAVLISPVTGVRVDLKSTVMLAMGQYGHDDAEFPLAVSALTDHAGWVLFYLASLYWSSGCIGERIHDSDHSWLGHVKSWLREEPAQRRFREWEETLRYDGSGVAVPFFATIVVLGGEPHLFVGVLDDVTYSDSGEPVRFTLLDAHRRKLSEKDSEFYQIKGDRFFVRSNEACTLNLLWYAVEE